MNRRANPPTNIRCTAGVVSRSPVLRLRGLKLTVASQTRARLPTAQTLPSSPPRVSQVTAAPTLASTLHASTPATARAPTARHIAAKPPVAPPLATPTARTASATAARFPFALPRASVPPPDAKGTLSRDMTTSCPVSTPGPLNSGRSILHPPRRCSPVGYARSRTAFVAIGNCASGARVCPTAARIRDTGPPSRLGRCPRRLVKRGTAARVDGAVIVAWDQATGDRTGRTSAEGFAKCFRALMGPTWGEYLF